MKKRALKCMSVMLSAGMILMSAVSGTAVYAAQKDGAVPQIATITAEITKETNDYAPATSFEYTISPGSPVEATVDSDAIYAGVEGGAAINGTILSKPEENDIGKTTVTAGTTNISINPASFTKPGIYRYEVKEIAGNYEGITYADEIKFFDVYITNKTDGTEGLEVGSYRFTDVKTPSEKDDGVFTNAYDVHNLTVQKTVTGNQGDKKKDFSFTLKTSGAEGERYYMTVGNQTFALEKDQERTITLQDNQKAVIYGLSNSDSYTVTEADYSKDGYTTTIDGTKTNTASGTISKDITLAVTNHKNVSTPTGIVLQFAPYILMILCAGAAAFVFLRRKKEFR